MKKKKQKKLSDPEKKVQQQKRLLKRKIKSIFENAGFIYLNSSGKAFNISGREVELDSVFLYENIIVICEDTITDSNKNDHIRTKSETFTAINSNRNVFFEWIKKEFTEYKENIEKYNERKYKISFLYFSQSEIELNDKQKKELYPLIKFVEEPTLNYFCKISKCIKLSSKYELFKFLGIRKNEIGNPVSTSGKQVLKAQIIYPEEITGLRNGVRVVSFMMSAQSLISMSYVMRKDNWEESVLLYQRLIDSNKIKKIRKFIAENKQAFYNNIIVALPDDVSFCDKDGNPVSIDELKDFESCKLEIPEEMNSICIIDGQHRIYAHYEGDSKDKYEPKIKPLRDKLHLLVTGLLFPEGMSEIDKIKFQSELFLDINSNATPVPPDVLLHITMLKDPLCDVGIARKVLEQLNKKSVFLNKFEFSTLDVGKIKIASIIKFALRYLVTITPQDEKESLYSYWTGDKEKLRNNDPDAYNAYIDFCTKTLEQYFSALKYNYKDIWEENDNKLLSTISLNGFIIAFNRQLKDNGIRDYEFYNTCFKKLKTSIDFSNDKFKYTSSQYRQFSSEILEKAFSLDVE